MGERENLIGIRKPSDNILPEFLLAILVAGGVILAVFSNLLFLEESFYNETADGMGHLTKVVYLAEHWKNLEFPSWCPFWYNGSTMTQYYAPLGYWMMAIAQIFTGDVMLTMKIYCFVSLFFGSIGVWAISRRFIGNWVGLISIVMYGLQPYLTITLLDIGALAQGVIFLFTPWLLYSVFSFFCHHNRKDFVLIFAFTGLLILSHAMHAFMICLAIAIVALPYVISQKIPWISYVLTGLAMGVGALACSFWWFVGVTPFENPSLPYLLEESTVFNIATLLWFTSLEQMINFRFAISATTTLIIAFIVYKISFWQKWTFSSQQLVVSFSLYLSLYTILFSFGQNLSILKYFPLISSMVPGRILSMTSVTVAVAGAFLVKRMAANHIKKPVGGVVIYRFALVLVIGFILWDMNPFKQTYSVQDYDALYQSIIPTENLEEKPFEKGRYAWLLSVNCSEAYFPVVAYNYNIAEGWNLEGSQHNRTLIRKNVAHVCEAEEYVVKNILFWNVKYISIHRGLDKFSEVISNYGFEKVMRKSNLEYSLDIFMNPSASSYFLIDPRDVLVVGPGASGLALEFPFMVQEFETDITKFDLNELLKYRVIYIAEPELNGTSKILAFEKRVEALVNQGVYVIVELSRIQRLPVFDVTCKEYQEKHGVVLSGAVSCSRELPFGSEATERDVTFFGLDGLDKGYFSLYSSPEHKMGDVVGEKKVGKGSVIMIGSRLTQYLQSPTVFVYGYDTERQFYIAEPMKKLLLDILEKEGFQHSFVPESFLVDSADWDYQGVVFSYNAPKPEEVTVSVTYTPRWKAWVDGEKWTVRSRENLIVLDLPAGEHEVELHYVMTVFGYIGYGLSFLGVVILFFIVRKYSYVVRFTRYIGKRLVRFFQFPSKQWGNG